MCELYVFYIYFICAFSTEESVNGLQHTRIGW